MFYIVLVWILMFYLSNIVAGESGLGKSTLVNSLFLTDLYPERNVPGAKGKFNAALFPNPHPPCIKLFWLILKHW